MIRVMNNIDERQFAFVPGRGTIDAIFIVRQLQDKYLPMKDFSGKNLTLYNQCGHSMYVLMSF